MQKKLFLLDAFALVFRAYYALIRNPRITSTGRNTNAQFGFTNTLVELITKQKPTHMAVCFDTHAPTERHTDFSDYKANRQETPEDLLAAVPEIKRIIRGFNIPVVELDGYEADDVIGTLAWQAHDAGYEVFMVTPDKDYGQLVREGISIYKPGYQGGDVEIMGPKEVCVKWDIARVDQVIDVLGLMGDAVDNIPGIPGVGEKTAAKLLKEFDTLENVLANADNIKGALGEKVRKGKELAVMSKKLATIITNVPVQFHEESFKLAEWNKPELEAVFADLEFKTLGQRILGKAPGSEAGTATPSPGLSNPKVVQTDLFGQPVAATGATDQPHFDDDGGDGQPGAAEAPVATANLGNTPHQYHLVDTTAKIDDLLKELLAQTEICFDTETTHIDANLAELVGISFAYKPGEAYYIPCPEDKSATGAILKQLAPLFAKADVLWIGQNIKYDLLVLRWYGYQLAGPVYDTMLAHYVFEPEGKRSMDALAEQYLQYTPVSITELIGKKGKGQGTMREVDVEVAKDYAAEDADITLQLKHRFVPLVLEKQVDTLLHTVENPLVKVLAAMEFEGI
ncbi:MAG: DNA polymerase I, partial [Bacteroidetes bacterium]